MSWWVVSIVLAANLVLIVWWGIVSIIAFIESGQQYNGENGKA